MVIIGRWNYQTHEYDPYIPPEGWKIVLYTTDMDEGINCTNCGKAMTYGDGLTSKELHNGLGLGYPVCQSCYDGEIKRWKDNHDTTD